jgi:GNAT superfamily N-acetyltransferase
MAISTRDEARAELQRDIHDPRFAFFVAEHRERVVGTSLACSVDVSSMYRGLLRPLDAALLAYAAVFPEARGLGAGGVLGETVLAWARDAGYHWVAVDWRSGNLEAGRAWTRLGFRPTFRRLHRAIA